MKINNNIGYLINRTGLRMKLEMQHALSKKGYSLTTDHWGLLQKLYEKDGLPQVELANLLNKDKPNITRILDIMEKNDLISRKSDPFDRRKFLIFLTDKTKKMKNDLFVIASEVTEKSLIGISQTEIHEFMNVLNKIYLNLE